MCLLGWTWISYLAKDSVYTPTSDGWYLLAARTHLTGITYCEGCHPTTQSSRIPMLDMDQQHHLAPSIINIFFCRALVTSLCCSLVTYATLDSVCVAKLTSEQCISSKGNLFRDPDSRIYLLCLYLLFCSLRWLFWSIICFIGVISSTAVVQNGGNFLHREIICLCFYLKLILEQNSFCLFSHKIVGEF